MMHASGRCYLDPTAAVKDDTVNTSNRSLPRFVYRRHNVPVVHAAADPPPRRMRTLPIFGNRIHVGASGCAYTHIPLTFVLFKVRPTNSLTTTSSMKPLSRCQQYMGRVFSKFSNPTKTAGDPRVPQELVDEVLDHLADDMATLRLCSLVAKSWIYPSRCHIFKNVFFTVTGATKWNRTFPNPKHSPAGHVRDLSFCFIHRDVPIDFADRMPYFSNVQKLTLIGQTAIDPGFISALGQLPPSTRSLDITFSKILNAHIISVMQQLPNLDNLSLMSQEWGGPILPGSGRLIQGRLSGKLRLRRRSAHRDLLGMLMEIPMGPQFTEVEIRDARIHCFPATLELVKACQDTLTKLHFSTLVMGNTSPSLTLNRVAEILQSNTTSTDPSISRAARRYRRLISVQCIPVEASTGFLERFPH